MKIAYCYKSKKDYVEHLKEFFKKGIYFPGSSDTEFCSGFYDSSEDFILVYVEGSNVIKYSWKQSKAYDVLKEYKAKNTNIDNY